MNEYYTPLSLPREFARARAAQLGAEFHSIEQGFGALPTRSQLANGTAIHGVEQPSAAANHYVLETDYSDQTEDYQPGQQVLWFARKSNTGAATMSIDGKRGVALVEVNGAPLTTASIVSGWPVWAGYDGGKFHLLNSAKRIAATVIFVKAADNRTFEADEAITDFELPAATSGAAPYTYAVSGLPAGLTFNTATRMVSGTPTALAASTVTYTATDANSDTVEQTFEILIVSVLLNLPSAADLTLIIGRSYDIELPAATGGSAPYTYAVNGLPAGLGFDQTSRSVFGAPAEAGIFSFGTVAYSATDSLGQRSEHSFSIIVREASSLALPAIAVRGFTLNDPIAAFELPAATDGTPPYTYAAAGLPAGLVFDAATRRVSGTPTALGESTVTLTVTDADSETAEQTFVIVISAAGYRYVAVTADKDNITAAIVTGGTSAPGESTLLTLPLWSGNRYIVIAQLAAFPPLILISLGLGNSISAFTRAVGGVTIDGDSYDLWVSNDLQGDVISGGTLTVG